jgi:hypothetical protein
MSNPANRKRHRIGEIWIFGGCEFRVREAGLSRIGLTGGTDTFPVCLISCLTQASYGRWRDRFVLFATASIGGRPGAKPASLGSRLGTK